MVQDVPDPVTGSASPDRVAPREAVTIAAEVDDSSFARLNDAQVLATVTAPDGQITEVPLEWTLARDGEYQARFTPEQDGLHEIRIGAHKGGKSVGESKVYLNVAQSDAEYYDAYLHADLLKRVAEETGGRYYTPASVGSLAEDVSYTGRGDT